MVLGVNDSWGFVCWGVLGAAIVPWAAIGTVISLSRFFPSIKACYPKKPFGCIRTRLLGD